MPSQLPYTSVAADDAFRVAPRLKLDNIVLSGAIPQVLAQLDASAPDSSTGAGPSVLPGTPAAPITAVLDAEAADSWLLLVDLSAGSTRLGESLLVRTLLPDTPAQLEPAPADVDPAALHALQQAVRELADAGTLLAARWRGSGGLVGCLVAMTGQAAPDVAINIDALLIEGDGDGRMDSGEAKNWTTQISGLRHELSVRALFTEAPGVVLQVPGAGRRDAMQALRRHGLGRHSHFIAHLHAGQARAGEAAAASAPDGRLSIWRDTQSIFAAPLAPLRESSTRPAAPP